MKKMTAIALASAVLLAACSTQTANLQPSSAKKLAYSESETFFLFGIGQTRTVNAANICGSADKVVTTKSHLSGENILMGIITLGIYTPRTSEVYCKQN